jgi:anti-sigma B factor antagonist
VTPGRSENLVIEMSDSPKGARIMTLIGPLTLSTLFDFQAVSRSETAKAMVVDISRVPYMDSAGLGAMISLFASCQRTSRGFAITGLSERIKTLFQVTHCDGLLPCFETLDAAESSVAA